MKTHTPAPQLPNTGYSRWQQLAPFMPFSRETWRLLVKAGKDLQPTYLSKRCKIYPNAEVHRWFADPNNYRTQRQGGEA